MRRASGPSGITGHGSDSGTRPDAQSTSSPSHRIPQRHETQLRTRACVNFGDFSSVTYMNKRSRPMHHSQLTHQRHRQKPKQRSTLDVLHASALNVRATPVRHFTLVNLRRLIERTVSSAVPKHGRVRYEQTFTATQPG